MIVQYHFVKLSPFCHLRPEDSGINSVDNAQSILTFQSLRLLPHMLNIRTSPAIHSSVPKAGVVRRNKKTPLLSDKPFTISIIYDVLGIEMVKYTRYQRLSRPYIIDSSSTPSVYSECLKA